MEIARRHVLSLLSAAGLAAVIPATDAAGAPLGADGTGAGAAAGTQPAAGAGAGRLLANAVAVFAGTPESNARAETSAKLAALAEKATAHLAKLDAAGEGELFEGLPLGTSDAHLNTSFRMLYEIALASRAPGVGTGGAAARRRVVEGLVRLHEDYYGDQSRGYYGNWFTWEIGISTSVTATLVLLADEIAEQRPELTRTYITSMDAYLRNGEDGDVDLDSRFHTGANLADITTNRLLQGALLGDEKRIRKALEDQLTVYATVDPYRLRHGVTDGHYADGSFIQHGSVAYTGSYGKGLLTRAVQALGLLDGTGFADTAALVPVVYRWVADGFAPLVFEGWMMEIVKGRAVSRTGGGYADSAAVVEAVTALSAYADGERSAALKSYVKHVARSSADAPDPARFASPPTVVRYAEILGDTSVPAKDLNPAARSTAFNAMDKTVHRRPGFAFALARSSDRVSKYEYMSGENLMPWFQGDGAHYLYLAGRDQARSFGADYFTTVSPYGLAGVTAPEERRETVPELYGKAYYDNPDHPLHFTPSSESQNTYVYFPRGTNRHSGGAVLGAYGAAGMVQSDDVGYAERDRLPDDFTVYRNATATKSWFLLDEEIVVLAAGVGDRGGRPVRTTVDARIADPDDVLAVTGRRAQGGTWSGESGQSPDSGESGEGTARLRWLRYANETRGGAVGYLMLDERPRPLTVGLETVTRSRRAVRTANPDTPVTRQVFSAAFRQEAGAEPRSYAYALVPHATRRALDAYGEHHGRHRGPRVLTNTTRLQAIRHSGLGLLAVNAFARGRQAVAGLHLDGPASVLVRREGRAVTIAASDPTMRRDEVSLLLHGRRLRPVEAGKGVHVSHARGGTLVRVRTRHAYGHSFTVTLR
ncbi:polysaccharide lyase beta-sandwich domain-containing protein [Streptomyces tubbatahanensis]|uniref:Polysaccharide lyase beta-sandwich domain-containing protein n=1 Tax=Streptomyces tubbatahanensis TaxID=2923272 RepID=A0ABY3XZ78_9ACTN|nr:polysaccharide lyase family 8 super-sandwich domain-containing protein [Streptomyces tubbatahanensis]UNS99854.1 polysaccharide lyase beta-sandwich domain-containing protein [Streptomyces tubbatahanensis]